VSKSKTPPKRLGRGLGALIPNANAVTRTPPAKPPAATVADPQPEPEPEPPPQPEPQPRTDESPSDSTAPTPPDEDGPSAEPGAASGQTADTPSPSPFSEGGAVKTIPIERLRPNPEQPRKRFAEDPLRELAQSIRASGIIQPIVARPMEGQPGVYEILAGERRWRAAQLAGVHDVPVLIRTVDPDARLELALIENLHREDLTVLEEARAYERLIALRGYTQSALADRVGKERSTIANTLRLLRLPPKVQDLLQTGRIGMGHARALLGLDDPAAIVELALDVVRRALSVRATEAEVARTLRALESRLRRTLGTKVKLHAVKRGRGGGKIVIPYSDLDDLNRLLRQLLNKDE
jgi:ParB family chromosome partitioning protein